MMVAMTIKGKLNYRAIEVSNRDMEQLTQLGGIRHNIHLDRWELTVPTQRVFNAYIAHYRRVA